MKSVVMKKLILAGCTAVAVMSMATFSYAADTAAPAVSTNAPSVASGTLKVGIIDVARILQESPQMQETFNKLKKKFKPRQDKLAEIHKKIVDDEAKIKRDGSVMSKSEMNKVKEQIGENQREFRRLQEDYVEDTRAAQREAMEGIMQKVNDIVQKIADSDKYDIIFQRDVVAFGSPRLDITPQIIKALKEDKK